MSDDLNDLKKLMDAATPQPNGDARAKNIALAEKNFADLQGSRDEQRLTSDRPRKGFISGVKNMLNLMTSRAGLTASTALIAVGLVAFTPIGEGLMNPGTFNESRELQGLIPSTATPSRAPAVRQPVDDSAGVVEDFMMVAPEPQI